MNFIFNYIDINLQIIEVYCHITVNLLSKHLQQYRMNIEKTRVPLPSPLPDRYAKRTADLLACSESSVFRAVRRWEQGYQVTLQQMDVIETIHQLAVEDRSREHHINSELKKLKSA